MDGYGVQFWPILQDFSQLISTYGASADTFLANAEVLQAFNVQDLETAKRLSDRMGDRTIMFTTETRRIPARPRPAPSARERRPTTRAQDFRPMRKRARQSNPLAPRGKNSPELMSNKLP